ncbi:MAG: HAMP domain-containing protein [Eubacterium sp.]|nr:HAMP domain-containing protein [Eubacterium sp.]
MRHSIRIRLILLVSLMLIAEIAVIFFMNVFLLPHFYQTTKISQMRDVYSEVSASCSELNLSDITDEEKERIYDRLDSVSDNRSVSIYIMQISADDTGSIASINYIYPVSTGRMKNMLMNQIAEYVRAMYFGEELGENFELIEKESDHAIYKVYDERVDSDYIELTGQLPDGYWLYLRASYTGIQEGSEVSNRFLIYVGGAVLLISIILAFIIANHYTRPILKLAEWAERMRGLDFSSRYETDRADEIGVLASGMNELSDKLEATISELKTANNELQHDIEKKTMQEQMRQEFLANVSHELKTPIALVQGYAEGLKDNVNDDPESRDFYCDVIIDEANKMNQMVKKLLTLNQLEFGSNQIHMEHFDLRDLVRSVVASNEIRFSQKETELKFIPHPEPVMVWADEYMIEEVLTNYISNALNHVEEVDGHRIIKIKSVVLDEKVRISVFNTGRKIPDEDITKIWTKFYKVDKARTREYGGNGIGLSIVKAIMEAHNNGYGVMNYDNGVEFWFDLDIK